MIQIEADFGPMEKEFARLEAMPMGKPVELLTAALALALARTQAQAHMRTGKLKASGASELTVHEREVHTTISYDAEPGIYELDRGGAHDFFRAPEPDPAYIEAIIEGLRP